MGVQMIRCCTMIGLLLSSVAASAQQPLDVDHAVAPFQQQRNAAADAAAFCSINLTQAQAEIADLKRKLAEAEAKVTKEASPNQP